ncbi:cytochrome P450 [Apodospora peruviana]|uniref:Cytochrome P450 n=1 Tax=Apodospora peruviana TaxID=516989 RepID=A0AAE0HUK3_9PEZI|nr:cytochrome P450 [Apodospora peruviana]
MAIVETLYAQRWPLAAGILVLFLVRKVYIYNRLHQFKGPFGTGFTQLPHSLAIGGPEAHKWYRKVAEKYGPIARVGPNTLVTSNIDVWLHVNVKPGYKRTDWYYHAARVEHRKDNVFTMTNNEEHEKRRKMIAPGYSGRDNENIESPIDARISEFISLVRQKYLSTDSLIKPMDLAKKMQYLTLDIISTVGLGKGFGMLQRDADVHSFIKSAEEGLWIAKAFLALGLSGLAQTPYIGRYLGPQPTDAKGFGKMIGTCFQYADERASNMTEDKRSDMLASWLKHGVSRDALRSEAAEQVIAGSDTSAAVLRGTMLALMANRRVYGKLQAEIDAAVRDGLVSGEGIIKFEEAKKLPYLQAVLREGLRWFPGAVNFFPRDVPAGGDTVTVDGKPVFLPGGTEIGVAIDAMQHSKEVFGDDADSFRPERWLDLDNVEPDRRAAMLKVSDVVFGHGKWRCLGEPVARYELSKVIFELVRNFDWALQDPTKPWDAWNSLGLFIINDMWVQVTGR